MNISKDNQTNINIHFPGEMDIVLVQANDLKYYEIFQWLAFLFSPISASFWTSYSANRNAVLLFSALAFTLTGIIFVTLAIYFRHRMNKNASAKSVSTKILEFKN